mmetsp:Transcript_58976/g.156398  ORF Transcript_58976/g.156398 Transcript_58976/m.156398 type:complete len:560 (-) Transcript_58976:776-2455(-)
MSMARPRPGLSASMLRMMCFILIARLVSFVRFDSFRNGNSGNYSRSQKHLDVVHPAAKLREASTDSILRYVLPGGNEFFLKQIPWNEMISRGKQYSELKTYRWKIKSGLKRSDQKRQKHNFSPLKPIRRVWVWGERCSCTTAITDLLSRNFDTRCNSRPVGGHGNSSCVMGGLPWKHGFMRHADLEQSDETLHILVTRHPYEWIESMQRNGFYAPFHKGLPMKQFLALEWLSLDMSPSHLLMVENHLRTNPPQQTGAAPGRRFLLSPQASVQGTALDGVGSHAQPQPSPQQRTACSAQRQGQNRSTCWHQDAEFSCVPAPLATAAGAEDGNARPIQGCLPREISRRVCHPRALLCKRRHPFLTSLHVTFWERAAKAVAVTTGDEAADDFRELLASGTAAQDWEAAEQEDLRTASGCAAGAPSCFVPSIPADSSAFGDLVSKHRSQCCANNRTFSCVVAPEGFQVLEDPGWFPSKFCLDEATNLRKCGAGFLLCRTDSKERYPWIVDPVAWKHVSALLHRDPRKPDPANPRLSQWTKNNNMAGSNFRQLFPAARDTGMAA